MAARRDACASARGEDVATSIEVAVGPEAEYDGGRAAEFGGSVRPGLAAERAVAGIEVPAHVEKSVVEADGLDVAAGADPPAPRPGDGVQSPGLPPDPARAR